MAQITLGGKDYVFPEMNFLAIERAWPFVTRATETTDAMAGVSASLGVFAAAYMEAEEFKASDFGITDEFTPDASIHRAVHRFFKKNLKGNEMGKVKDTMFEILKEAGLEVTEGESMDKIPEQLGIGMGSTMPSPETAADILLSSLQPELKEEAGTP